MKVHQIFVFLCLLMVSSITAQVDVKIFSELFSQNFTRVIHQFRTIQAGNANAQTVQKQQDDLIIGLVDPDEVVNISGNFSLFGDLIILNNGKLILDSADFQIDGNIFISGRGQLKATGGTFTVLQEYIYEHSAVVTQGGLFQFTGVTFKSNGQSWSNTFLDSAQYFLEGSKIKDGFITTTLSHRSTARIEKTHLPGEFLCFGNNNLSFRDSDTLLMWIVLPETSVVDATLPDDSLLVNWNFSKMEPGISGIPYQITIDSCTNVYWGLISISGSKATFRNSKLRAAGLLFTRPDSIVVSNITNGSTYIDEQIQVPDRSLRFVNSEVATWNFYPTENARITIRNCVFGEMISQGTSLVLIDNSLCDGSGGYVGAFDQSFLIIFRSLVNTQVITRQEGTLIGALSAFMGPEIDADEFSIMGIFNTTRMVEPEAHHSGIIFEGQMPPVEGFVDDEVPIPGTARIIAGQQSPIQFEGYLIEYSFSLENPVWLPTDGLHVQPVKNDTLAVWNTTGLPPGIYGIQLSIYHNLGDSIAFTSIARLDAITDVAHFGEMPSTSFSLAQNYPNPFNPTTTIRYSLPRSMPVRIKVFDSLGREVQTLVDQTQPAGIHEITFDGSSLASGFYYYELKADNYRKIRRMLLVK